MPTSSSQKIAPVIELDGKPEGDGSIGTIWEKAKRIYNEKRFDFDGPFLVSRPKKAAFGQPYYSLAVSHV